MLAPVDEAAPEGAFERLYAAQAELAETRALASLVQQRADVEVRLALVEEREVIDLAHATVRIDQMEACRVIEASLCRLAGPFVIGVQHSTHAVRRVG